MKTRKILCLLLTSLMLTSLFIITQISSVSAVNTAVSPLQWGQIRANDTLGTVPRTSLTETYNNAGFNSVWYVGSNNGNSTKADYRESMFAFKLDATQLAYIDAVDASNGDPITLSFTTKKLTGSGMPISIYLVPSEITLESGVNFIPTLPTIPLQPFADTNGSGSIDSDDEVKTGVNYIFNAANTAIAQGQYHKYMVNYLTARESLQFIPGIVAAVENIGAGDSEFHTVNITSAIKDYRAKFPDENRFAFIFANNTIGFQSAIQGGAAGESGVRLNIPITDVRTSDDISASVTNNGRFYASVEVDGTLSTDKIDVTFVSAGNSAAAITKTAAEDTTSYNVTVPEIVGNNELYNVTVTVNNEDGREIYTNTFENLNFYTNTVYFESNGGVQKDNTGGNINKMIKSFRGVADGQPLFTSETVTIDLGDGELISFEERTSIIPEITKKYYKFAGWYKDSGFVTPWIIGDETEDDSYDTVNGDVTLYAKWTADENKPAEADGSKLIELPSFDASTRVSDNTINAQTAEQVLASANVVKYQDNSVAPGGGQLALGYRGDSYREAYFRYDLSAADVDAILRAEGASYTNGADGRAGNKAVFEFTAYKTDSPELTGNKTVNAYFLPANKVSAFHNSYATANSTGVPYELGQTIGFNYVTAIENGITVRDNTDLRNAGPVASVSYEVVSNADNQIIQLDLTEALQKYFIANPGVTNFGLVLTNVDSTNNLCGIYNSKVLPDTYRPKLYIPAPREDYPDADIIPVNQEGQALSLTTLNGATKIIFKDGGAADAAYTPVIAIYGGENKLLNLKVIPVTARFDTPYLTRLNLPEPITVPEGAVFAKIILIDSLGNIKPVKDFKLVE